MGDTPATDKRLEFLEEYVIKTMKLKAERWQKCIAAEEHKKVIQDFLDRPDQITLVLSLNAAGHLLPSSEFPATSRNKSVYFVKRGKDVLNADSIKSNLSYGDLSHSPLDQFSALVEEVRLNQFVVCIVRPCVTSS